MFSAKNYPKSPLEMPGWVRPISLLILVRLRRLDSSIRIDAKDGVRVNLHPLTSVYLMSGDRTFHRHCPHLIQCKTKLREYVYSMLTDLR